MTTKRASGDEGVVLIVALITIMVVSLLLAGLLSLANASQANTRGTRDHDGKVYAADAGIDYGIQAVRRDNTLCPEVSGASAPISTQTINGRQVDIACRTLSGSANGIFGYAVIALDGTGNKGIDTGSGFFTSCDPTETNPLDSKYCPPSIDGPAYAASLPNTLNLKVKNGDLFEKASGTTCSDTTTEAEKPAGVSFEPLGAYHYRCITAAPPDPAPTLPTSVPLVPVGLNPVVVGTCRVFKPGLYTAATMNSAILGDHSYFISGAYYFVDVNLTLKDQDLRGGAIDTTTTPPETAVNTTASPCDGVKDTDVPGGVLNGTGVKVILGGSSSLHANNPDGKLELFARKGGAASEGTQGVSVMTVPNTAAVIAAGWLPSTLSTAGSSDSSLQVDGNPGVVLGVHGMVYTPNAKVELFATNGGAATLQGGAVVARIFIQGSAVAKNLAVSIPGGTGVRRTVITATAKGVGRDVIATAVVTIGAAPARTVTIESWRSS